MARQPPGCAIPIQGTHRVLDDEWAVLSPEPWSSLRVCASVSVAQQADGAVQEVDIRNWRRVLLVTGVQYSPQRVRLRVVRAMRDPTAFQDETWDVRADREGLWSSWAGRQDRHPHYRWQKHLHKTFPRFFRERVVTVLCVCSRLDTQKALYERDCGEGEGGHVPPTCWLPLELWMAVLGHMYMFDYRQVT